jgi:hypothetical protein
MKPNPLSLTSRLIVPFIGAIGISGIHRISNAPQQDVIARDAQRLPEDRSALDERSLVYARSGLESTPFRAH